jgi:hypothetical protein
MPGNPTDPNQPQQNDPGQGQHDTGGSGEKPGQGRPQDNEDKRGNEKPDGMNPLGL